MYQKINLPFSDIPQFSDRDKAYQGADPRLREFYEHEVSIDAFANVFKARKDFEVDRSSLVNSLVKDYERLVTSDQTLDNIKSLGDSDTYTIVTAHQPSILTGPLYFNYKICSVISLSQKLNSKYTDYHVVPVFVMGGEDHDFEEIATLHLFGQDFTWETDQVGATGRMNLTGLEEVLEAVQEKLGDSDNAASLKSMIDTAYEQSDSYGQFMVHLVNALFGRFGLVICNMDNPNLKQSLLPYVTKDIQQRDSERCVQDDQAALATKGFKSQAHARGVNIFWHDGDRHRVISEGDKYTIGERTLSESALIAQLNNDPGSISPNVVLRPVYQEVALPNLAYIGGGGELAYWLERKSLFETWNIPFPMLIRRDSVMIVDKKSAKFVASAGLEFTDVFEREEQLVGKYAHAHAAAEIDFTEQRAALKATFESLAATAKQIDPTLERTALSEESKAQKSIDMLENKLLKAEKQKNEVALNKLKKIKNKFFPGNDGLQERYDNFIPFYLKHGEDWIAELILQLDPLDKSFKILVEA